ncbi:MAG TPA: hypothetical protein VN224_04480 [Xanthomonadales bacterium]|nr:hypothetical protein [Xanthomonadales bacterium]
MRQYVPFKNRPQRHHRHVVETRAEPPHVFPRNIRRSRDETGSGKNRDLIAVDRAACDFQEIALQPVRVDDIVERTTRFVPHAAY